MQFIRGTTPTITITVTNEDIDLSDVTQVWIYVSQRNKPKIDKNIDDVTIDTENKTFTVTLTQDDTLALRAGECYFQMRVLLADETALATVATKITVLDVYKNGVIKVDDEE